MEILDSKEEWRAVRLDNGRLGVTDAQGKVLMRFAAGEKMAFVEHDFLRVSGRGVRFFVDMRSQQVYAERPKLLSFGQLELLQVGNLVYTRTKRVYEVNTGVWLRCWPTTAVTCCCPADGWWRSIRWWRGG